MANVNLRKDLADAEVLGLIEACLLPIKQRLTRSHAGVHRSTFHGISTDFVDHKQYTPGEDLKFLDWKVYSRFERYCIKKFQEETRQDVWLLLDSSASMSYTSGGPSKFDVARRLSAALALLWTNQSDRIGLCCFSEKADSVVLPQQDPQQIARVFHHMEEREAGGKTDFPAAIAAMLEQVARRSLVFICSDFFFGLPSATPIEEALAAFRAKQCNVILLHVLDPGELTLSFNGKSQVVCLETARTMTIDANAIKKSYAEKMGRFLVAFQEAVARLGMHYCQISTATPLRDHIITHILQAPEGFYG